MHWSQEGWPVHKKWGSLQSHWPLYNPWNDPFTLGQMKFSGRASSPTHIQRKAPRMNTAPFGWSNDGLHFLFLFLPQIFSWISGTGSALARSMGEKQGPFCHNRDYSQGNKQCASHGNSDAAWSGVTCYPRPGVEPSQQYRCPLPLPISDVPMTWTTEHAAETVCSSQMPLDLLACESICSLCCWSHFVQVRVQRARSAWGFPPASSTNSPTDLAS